MVEIKDPSVHSREKDFVADEISFVNFVVRDYNDPTLPEPHEYESLVYDKKTKDDAQKMREQGFKERAATGLKGAENIAQIALMNSKIETYKQERAKQRDAFIETRAKELAGEMIEEVKTMQKLGRLEDTIKDGRDI